MAEAQPVIRGDVRVFFLEGGAGPNASASYEGFAKVARPVWNFGDITNHYAPSSNARRQYRVVAKTSGAESPPEMPLTRMYDYAISKYLRLGRQKCDHDLQAHMGNCALPQNFNAGYDKILILEKGRIRSWGLDGDLGSLNPTDEGISNEEVPFAGELLYEVKRFDNFSSLGTATIVRPIVDGVLADEASCGGDCGLPSDGCQIFALLSSSSVGSPGLEPTVYYSFDGGSTITAIQVGTLGAAEDAEAIAFDGTYIFVASGVDEGVHYVPLEDLRLGAGSFTKVAGFTTSKGPRAIYVAGPNDIFYGGLGGYIYRTSSPTDTPTVLDAGSATVQNINSIHGIDDIHIAAVGASNAFIYTTDGETWAAKTGPAVGVALNRVWMVSANVIWVGAANGTLYYTTDGGDTWHTKGFSGSGTGSVLDIVFTTRCVGFLSHRTAGNVSRIFKTIDGGGTWQILPERAGTVSVPAHHTTSRILTCDQNTFYAAGFATGGLTGKLIKGS